MDEDRRRRYEEVYGRDVAEAEREDEREVFGTDEGIWSYTTPAQAEMLVGELDLGPGGVLLDVGSGRGWPSVYPIGRAQVGPPVTNAQLVCRLPLGKKTLTQSTTILHFI